jgi:hypothetical protein
MQDQNVCVYQSSGTLMMKRTLMGLTILGLSLLGGCATSHRYGADCGLPDGQWCGLFGKGPSAEVKARLRALDAIGSSSEPLSRADALRVLETLGSSRDPFPPPAPVPMQQPRPLGITHCLQLGDGFTCHSY